MPRPVWPPKYANVEMAVLLDDHLPHGAFRFYAKLRALSWGEQTFSIQFARLMELTGLSQTRVYEYARLLRDRNGLLFRCAQGVFECSFPEAAPIPGMRELPSLPVLDGSTPIKPDTKPESNGSRIAGKRETAKPPAVEAYHAVSHRNPDKAVWPMIVSKVGESPEAIERWKLTIQGWIAAGHNKVNVKGMLDWYGRGQTEKPAPNGHKAAPTGMSNLQKMLEAERAKS